MRVGLVIGGAVLFALGVVFLSFFGIIFVIIGLLLLILGAFLPSEETAAVERQRRQMEKLSYQIFNLEDTQSKMLGRFWANEELQREMLGRIWRLEKGERFEGEIKVEEEVPSEEEPEPEFIPRPFPAEFFEAVPEPAVEEEMVEEVPEEAERVAEEPLEAIAELPEEEEPRPGISKPRPAPEGVSRIEMVLGEKWFLWIGVILLAIAFAFILAITIPTMTPEQVVGLTFAVAIGIALLGEYIYTKQGLHTYAKGLEVAAFAIGHIGAWGGGFFFRIEGFPWHYILGALLALEVLAVFRYRSPLLAIQMGFLYLGWIVWLRYLQTLEAFAFALLLSVGAVLVIVIAYALKDALATLVLAFAFDGVALLSFSLAAPYTYIPVLAVGLITVAVVTMLRWEKIPMPRPEVRITAWAVGIILTYSILFANLRAIDDLTVLLTFATLTAAFAASEILAPDDELTLVFAGLIGILTFPTSLLMVRGEFALLVYPVLLGVLGFVRPVRGLAWLSNIVYVSLLAFAISPSLVDPTVQLSIVWALMFGTLALHAFLQERAGYIGVPEEVPTDFHVPVFVLLLTYFTLTSFPDLVPEALFMVAMPLSFVLSRKWKEIPHLALVMAAVTFPAPLFLGRGEIALFLFPAMLVGLHFWRPTKGLAWFANAIYISAIVFAVYPSSLEPITRFGIAWGFFFATVGLHLFLQRESGYTGVPEDSPTDLQVPLFALILTGLTAAWFPDLAAETVVVYMVAMPLAFVLSRDWRKTFALVGFMALLTFPAPLFLVRGEFALFLFPAMLLGLAILRPAKGLAWFPNVTYLALVMFASKTGFADPVAQFAVVWTVFFVTVVMHLFLQETSGYTDVSEQIPTDIPALLFAVVLAGLTVRWFPSVDVLSIPLMLYAAALLLAILLNRRDLFGANWKMATVIGSVAGCMFLARNLVLVRIEDFVVTFDPIVSAFHLAVMLALGFLVAYRRPVERLALDMPTKRPWYFSAPTLALLAGLVAQSPGTSLYFVALPIAAAVIAYYLNDALTFNIAYLAIVGQSILGISIALDSVEGALIFLPIVIAPMIALGFIFELWTTRQNVAKLTQLVGVLVWFVAPLVTFGTGLATTISWTVIGTVALAWGLGRRFAALRYLGFLMVFTVLGKVFLYDMAGLSVEYRILGLIILAIALLGISYGYARFRKGHAADG